MIASDAPDSPLEIPLTGFRDATAPVIAIDSGPSGTTNESAPTFGLSADEPATFECRLFEQGQAAPAFAACSGPGDSHTADPALTEGDYTFEVQATDEVANTDTLSREFTVDTTDPETTIDSGPSGTITVDQADFTFSSSEAGSTFECRVDAASFGACSGPGASHAASGLSDGPHTFEVGATDEAGNTDATPAAREFTVDTTVYEARIGKVKVAGPKKVRKGRKATYKVKVTNSGNVAATGVKLRVKGSGIKSKKSIGKIGAGKTRKVKVKVKPKKPGKVKAKFKVTSKNAGGKTVKKKLNVRK